VLQLLDPQLAQPPPPPAMGCDTPSLVLEKDANLETCRLPGF